jgi:hypothetical protein
MRIYVPATPRDAGTWLSRDAKTVELALNILPFAGIAFLWFMGVVRDHIGEFEDRFFSTVFLSSGLLFVAMLFVCAALAGSIISVFGSRPGLIDSVTYTFGRVAMYRAVNVFAVKMAGVFMISTSTILLRARLMPRWIALLGYVVAAVLLLTLTYIDWVSVLFPVWVLLISVTILLQQLRRPSAEMGASVHAPEAP